MNRKKQKDIILEEIALEGLDGITFQALWIRLSNATKVPLPFKDEYKEHIWSLTRMQQPLKFYLLEEPRGDLVDYDRFIQSDGVFTDNAPEDIYPHCVVDDKKKGIIGSCSTYYTRKNITSSACRMSCREIEEKWGNQFVIVASQKLREEALTGTKTQLDFTITRYCMLERIGRSRSHGEITHGINSLLALGEDPKTLFYHRKALLEQKLITKQVHHQKTQNSTNPYTGTLLMLRRFHVERKPPFFHITEKIVEYLKTRDHHMAVYEDFKKFAKPSILKKLWKHPDFQLFIKTDMKVPYRMIYPDASIKEWRLKAVDREKSLRVLQLIDPEKSVEQFWPSKEEVEENNTNYYLDYSKLCLFDSYLSISCEAIRSFDYKGCTQTELGQYLGMSKLLSRSCCRSLMRTNMVVGFLVDVGRQRVTRYIYRAYEHKQGSIVKIFHEERQKTIDLLLNKKSNKKSDEADPELYEVLEEVTSSSVEPGTSYQVIAEVPEEILPDVGLKRKLDESDNSISSKKLCLQENTGDDDNEGYEEILG